MNIRLITKATAALSSLHVLDSSAHKKILRTAVSILRRDGHAQTAACCRENLALMQGGVSWADPAVKLGDDAAKVALKYDKAARVCLAARQQDLAFTYLGAACRAIAEAGLPRASALELFRSCDLYDQTVARRYSPGSRQRARAGALPVDDPVDAVRRMQSALHSAKLGMHSAKLGMIHEPPASARRKILCSTLSAAERTLAGYLLYFYNAVLVNGEGVNGRDFSSISAEDAGGGAAK